MALDDVQFRTRVARAGSSDAASTCAGTLQGSQLGSLPSFAGLVGLDDATAEASPQPGPLQGRKRRPPTKTAKEKAGRKRQRHEARIAKQNQPASWKCPAPNCGWSTSGKYGFVMAHKSKHWETRHAELPKSLIFTKAEKISAISTSPLLPAHSRDWSCQELPKLDSGRRLASIRQRCDDRHPGETPSSLYHMRQRNSTNQGSGRHQGEVHAAARAEKFPRHTLVKVCPPERLAAGPVGKNNRARQYTCEQIQQRIKDNSTLQRLRRSWWLKLKSKEPKHAKALSNAVGLSFEAIDRRCWVHQAHSDKSRQLARARALAGVRPLRRKTDKQPLTRSEAEKRRGDPMAPVAIAKASASTSSTLAKASWRHGGHRGERIGEARHPGPCSSFSKFCLLTFNFGGPAGAC